MPSERKVARIASRIAVGITTLTGTWLLLGVVPQRLDQRFEQKLADLRALLVEDRAKFVKSLSQSVEESGRVLTTQDTKGQYLVNGIRVVEESVKFSRAFPGPPTVVVALSSLDFLNDQATMVEVNAINISAQGFTLRFSVRSSLDQTLSIGASWTAHHPRVVPRFDRGHEGVADS